MSVTGQQIADKAETLLLDEANVRWSATELLGWINSGLGEIVTYKPTAYVTTTTMQCVAGTKQTLPAGAIVLIDVTRNMGAAGTAPGRVITPVKRGTMDAVNPDWHAATPSASARHFIFDPKNPKTFYVSPPQPATGMGHIEVSFSASPPPLASLANNIPLDDTYESVLLDYVLYRAYSKDADSQPSLQRATTHYQAFANAVGAKLRFDFTVTPKMDGSDGQPLPGQEQ